MTCDAPGAAPTRRHRGWVLLLVMALSAAACSASVTVQAEAPTPSPEPTATPTEELPDTAPAPPTPTTPEATPQPTAVANPDPDLDFVDLEPDDRGRIVFDIGPGVASALLVAAAPSLEDEVVIFVVEAPDGTSLLDEVGELANFGEASVLLPLPDQGPLQPGEYVVAVDGPDDLTATLITKAAVTPDTPQVLDATFWLASSSEELVGAGRQSVADEFRAVGDEIFGSHGLAIGELRFVDAPATIVDRYRELELPSDGDDENQRRLCREMAQAFGPDRSLHLVVVDRIVDPDDPDGETLGNAAGIPGTPILEDGSASCVVVVAMGDDRGLADNAVTVWHEAGHFLGLFHTTEDGGEVFDIIADTPECPVERFDADDDGSVVDVECATVDGGNFMFYDGDGTEMTPGQAGVVRSHPLLRPA